MVAVSWTENFIDPNKKTKMRGNDRAFVLEKIDGKAPINSIGIVDNRLFTGENRIRAVRDEGSFNLWYFKYDAGAIPEELRHKTFTKFDLAQAFLQQYFAKRNIRIKEVID